MAEKRLIDANALRAVLKNEECDCEVFPWALDNAPTIDAVEVVRCQSCKHGIWDEENEMWKCVESAEYDENAGEWFGFYEYHKGDFYCAYGERREHGKA